MSKTAPPSPRLLRYDADIKAERNPVEAACLRAERAGFLARQGFFDAAREALDALQKEFGKTPDARLSIWMQSAEGWLSFYSDDHVAARDHFRRGYALSRAMNLPDLQALCAAWLANIAYLRDEFEDMVQHLRVSKELARVDDHLTQSRLCLVFALSYYFADRIDLAKPWFSKSRGHSAASNDEAALSALNYNMVYRTVYHLFVASINGESLESAVALAKVGVQSIGAFDQLLGISLVGSWENPLRAMYFSACKKYSEAAEIYSVHLDTSLPKGLMHQKAGYIADWGWCCFNMGLHERASELASAAELAVMPGTHVEDRLLFLGRLRQVYQGLGHQKLASQFLVEEAACANELNELRFQVLTLLSAES